MKYEDDHFTGRRNDPDKTIRLTEPEHHRITRVVAKARIGEGIGDSDYVGKMHARYVQLAPRLAITYAGIDDPERLAEINGILGDTFRAWRDEYEAE
jgi:hypothetical protein